MLREEESDEWMEHNWPHEEGEGLGSGVRGTSTPEQAVRRACGSPFEWPWLCSL